MLKRNHHTPSLFQIACQIPPNTKKSLLDAAGGFHAILLDKESQPMTTFNQLYYAAILQASQSQFKIYLSGTHKLKTNLELRSCPNVSSWM